jgi:predicted nucleotidyltransferase
MKATRDNIILFLRNIQSDFSKNGVTPVGLFGSFARGEESIYSDIDIAVRKNKDFAFRGSAYDYFNEINRLKHLVFQTFHRNTDVFDLDSTSSFKDSILKDLIHV